MSRPRTPVGTFGDISFEPVGNGRVRARTRFRDEDGRHRRVQATGPTPQAAERNLKEQLTRRSRPGSGFGDLTPDSSFIQVVDTWLEDLDLERRVAPNTRERYEENMRNLVVPAFQHYTLREITVGRVDRFIKSQAAKSYGRAKRAKVVLNLAFGLAVRYEAIPKNPMRDTASCESLRRELSH